MTIYITKWVLTKGIVEAESDEQMPCSGGKSRKSIAHYRIPGTTGRFGQGWAAPSQWHETKQNALHKAIAMVRAKKTNIARQSDKLTALENELISQLEPEIS